MNVCIIPARGGSKGIVDKNLAKVGGTPLIARAIRAAQGAEWIHEIAVSTDSEEIAAVAAKEGADIVNRPSRLALDTSTSEEALLHALETYPEATNMAFIQCTSPFIRSAEIDACMKMVEMGDDCVFSVAETHSGYWKGMFCVSHNAGIQRKGRQVTLPLYRETGGIYAMRVKGFKEARNRFFGMMGMFRVSDRSAFEIDNPYDLKIAQAIAEII